MCVDMRTDMTAAAPNELGRKTRLSRDASRTHVPRRNPPTHTGMRMGTRAPLAGVRARTHARVYSAMDLHLDDLDDVGIAVRKMFA